MNGRNINPRRSPGRRLNLNAPSARSRAAVGNQELETLKQRLYSETVRTSVKPGAARLARFAANEAAALAWSTAFPALVFPVLFEEKLQQAANYAEHQAKVRRATLGLLAA